MNPKPESSKYLILKKNTPIKLSELLGEKDIPINSKSPKKYLITVRPHSNSLNSLIHNGRPNVRKFVFKLSDLLNRKSMLESSFIIGNRILEKIDEQSESSSTSAESQGCDLKLAEPLTDINRLRGGCGSKCCRERRAKTRNKCNQTDPEDSNTNLCKKIKKKEPKKKKSKTRFRSRCRRFRCLSPSVSSFQIYEADVITSHTKDAICQTKEGEKEKSFWPTADMLGLSPLDSETCDKVGTLEQQLRVMTDELKDLREELLAPDDLQKFKFLSEQFREVSELLTELKSNCVKCLKSTAPLVLEIQETCDVCKIHKHSRQKCNCNRQGDRGSHLNALPTTPRYHGSDYENSDSTFHSRASPKKSKSFTFPGVPNESDEEYGSPRLGYGSPREHYSPHSVNPTSPSSSTISKTCVYVKLPVINSKLDQIISRMIGNCKHENITLTVVLESTQLFHINVSVLRTGKSLGCIYATEPAINEAQRKHFFDDFLTFFVLNSKNTIEERNKMLNHSFDGKH